MGDLERLGSYPPMAEGYVLCLRFWPGPGPGPEAPLMSRQLGAGRVKWHPPPRPGAAGCEA